MMKKVLLTIAMAALFAACSPVEYDHFSTITGTVIDDEDQSSISGVSISLNPSGKSTFTDNNGYFQLVDLDAQSYTIQAQKTGYQTDRKTITDVAGETESVVFYLKRQQ